jgi:hypothetical protein
MQSDVTEVEHIEAPALEQATKLTFEAAEILQKEDSKAADQQACDVVAEHIATQGMLESGVEASVESLPLPEATDL